MATKQIFALLGMIFILLTPIVSALSYYSPYRYYEQVQLDVEVQSGYERTPLGYPGVYAGRNGYETSSHVYASDGINSYYRGHYNARYYPQLQYSTPYYRSNDYSPDRYYRQGRMYEFDHPRYSMYEKDYRTRRYHRDYDPSSRYFYDEDGSRYYYNSQGRRMYY
jgi:hypothetical protein